MIYHKRKRLSGENRIRTAVNRDFPKKRKNGAGNFRTGPEEKAFLKRE
jgi:hypothetical protein